jgi:hypothetical protein
VAHRRAAAGAHPPRLPRFAVLDWSPEEFEERVASWIG